MSESKWHLSRYNISAKIDEEDTWYVVNLYRNTCTPMSAAREKQISCRLVRLNMILLFTFVRSLGTEI